ncbi:MAG: diaminopimelate epimerase [Gammaproteobacteria bacterium]
MELAFTKMHGLGNDFIVLDGLANPLKLDRDRIQALADRRTGIGCDQVLLLEPCSEPDAHARLRIYNSDGGEAEQCGNGVRCVADYLHSKGYVNGDEVKLQSKSGLVRVFSAGKHRYRVDMGEPRFEPDAIPMRADKRRDRYVLKLASGETELSVLSMGNPHAVLKVDDIRKAEVERVGIEIQGQNVFPESINVGFVQILDPGHILLRVYERGAGETLACGSGACAAVVAGRLNYGLDEDVDVGLKGGHLSVAWGGKGEPVWMTGPAATVYEGRIQT